jgi:hypothetical protein
MKNMATHRERSKRNTRVAQAAALLLSAGAVGMAFVPAAAHSEPLVPGGGDPHNPDLKPAAAERVPDLAAAADVLSKRVVVQPLPEPQAEPPQATKADPGQKPPEETAPPVVDTGIRYCGSLIGPRSSGAFLCLGNEKAIVSEGQLFQGAKVVQVFPDKVVIEDSAGRRDLTVEARSASLFPDNPTVRAGGVTQPGVTEGLPPGFDKWEPERQTEYMNLKKNGNPMGGEKAGRPTLPASPNRPVPIPRPQNNPQFNPKNEKTIGKEGR